nr:integrase, catalytic region, zinc finger, CCHC-type, peptidase aspartic, catalytic [Tanacetum cinerariifolium]
EKKAKLFNEWEKFTSTDGESIESYYHRFMQLMNDLKRNKHFPENIAANLKAERLAKTHDPLALMAHSQNSYIFPATHNDQSSSCTHSQQSFSINNKYNPQPSLNQNFMQPPMTSLEDINDPTEAMNTALILFAKAFQLTAPTNNNKRTSSNPRNRQIAQPVMNMSQDRRIQNVGGNEWWKSEWACSCTRDCQSEWNWAEGTRNGNQARCYNCRGLGHIARNCTARPRRRDAAYLQTQLLIAQKEEAVIQLKAEEFDFMDVVGDLDEIKEVNANCILMANFQHASTSEQYTDLLEPISEPQLVPQNDNHVTSVAPSMVQSRGTVETSSALTEETHAHPKTVYRNLVDQVAQKMALGYPNSSYLKKAQLKQQSLYNGNLLLEEHDPPAVYDSEGTLELAQERVFVPQTTKSKEELFLSNVSNMVTVSKTIFIPNEDLSDDTTLSVARKFLNEVKSSLVTLQRVVKQKMTLEVHNWSSSAHKEVYKIISHEIVPIINQVDAKVQNFEIQFLQEAAKFVRDFKSLAKEADESLDKQNSLELEIERLLKASVNHDAMSIVQNGLVNVPSDLQTELDRTKEKLELCIIKKEKEYAVDKPKLIAVTSYSKKLHALIPSHSVPQPREFNVVKHRNVIALGIFKIDPSQTSRVDMVPNKQSSASIRTKPITNSQCHVTFKENVSSDMVNVSSTGLVHTARTRRPQPKGNTRNARVPSASKSSEVKKNITVEDYPMLVTANHDACLLSPVNALNSRANNLCANASPSANQKRHKTQVVQICLWCVNSGCSKHMTRNIKLLIKFVWKFLGTVRFGNDHIAAILGYGDLKWGNITITRVYFVEGLDHNLFSVGQFCDADLEVAFRRNTCFIRDLNGVDLLKGNRSTNLYTINLYDMASTSPICLMALETPTKSWLWNQRLSHLNFDTINDLAKNDLVSGLPKFKYAKEHLCPSCE